MKRKGYNVTYRGKKENLDKKCIVVKKTDNFCLKHPFDGTGLKNCEYRAPKTWTGGCPSVYFVGKIRYIYFNQTNKRIVCFKTHHPPLFSFIPLCPRCFRASSRPSGEFNEKEFSTVEKGRKGNPSSLARLLLLRLRLETICRHLLNNANSLSVFSMEDFARTTWFAVMKITPPETVKGRYFRTITGSGSGGGRGGWGGELYWK